MREGRQGSLGDAMERAEVEVTEAMAKICRAPGDYALFGLMGREAVLAVRSMTADQRSVFVARAAEAVAQAAEFAKANGTTRLQAALDFKPGAARPEYGFDDDDN